jgi:hypothetical protein
VSTTFAPRTPAAVGRGTLALAGVGAAALFYLGGWTIESLLSGDPVLEAVVTAMFGLVFFGWIAIAVLAILGTPAAWLLAALARQRRWTRLATAAASAASWVALLALPAAVGMPLFSASGFGLPALIPAAALAGAFAGYVVGGRRVTSPDAD